MLLVFLPGLADAQALRFVRMLAMDSRAGASLVAPDGRIALVWAAPPSSEMRFWNLENGLSIAESVIQDLGSCHRGVAWPASRHAVLSCRQPALIDLGVPEIVTRFGEFDWSTFTQVAVDPNLRRLVRVSRVYRQESDAENLPPDQIELFDLEEPGQRSWFGGLWYDWFGYDEVDADEVLWLPRRPYDSLYPSALSDDGRHLFMSDYKVKKLFSLEDSSLTVQPRGSHLELTGWYCGDRTARVTDIRRLLAIEKILRNAEHRESGGMHCRFRRDGRVVYFTFAGKLSAWDLTTGEELWSFDGAEYLDLSSNDEYLVVADESRRLTVLRKSGDIVAQASVTPEQFAPASRQFEKYRPCEVVHDPLSISADGRTVLYSHCAVFVFRLDAPAR